MTDTLFKCLHNFGMENIMFDNLLPPLNDHNLPYADTIHPIVVHFVIAMVLFAFFCDVVGYFTHNYKLYALNFV